MNEVQKAKIVLKELNKFYPKTPIPLKHKNIFTLLISEIMTIILNLKFKWMILQMMFHS